jgi:hypothetical protein
MRDFFLAENPQGDLYVEDSVEEVARHLDLESDAPEGFKFWYLKPTPSGYTLKRATPQESSVKVDTVRTEVVADGIVRGHRDR